MHSWFDEMLCWGAAQGLHRTLRHLGCVSPWHSRIKEKRDEVFELTTASFSAEGNACVTSLNVLASGTYLVPNLFFPGLTLSFTPCHWGYVTVRCFFVFFSSWECYYLQQPFSPLFKWELCDTSATNKNNPEQEKSQIAKPTSAAFNLPSAQQSPCSSKRHKTNRALLQSKSTQQQPNSTLTARQGGARQSLHHDAHGQSWTQSSPSSSPEKAPQQAVW